MTLAPGVRLGPYEIVSAVGAGGMGEVYRARDTKLNRDVAVKVLPTPFAADPDRLARFEREARVLASLNHPNIAQIYGLEESEGAGALVMEFVDGPTLADRIDAQAVLGSGRATRGLALNEALEIARQIMDALEAAHEQGIIHRDLKPANVKVRPDGAVKVLDFGLAKALATEPASGGISQSPTLTSPAATRVGVILGTASYMSPEQARGRAVDKRTDIWAFGCVLFEMLTGRRAFGGEDVTEVMGGVIHKEPDWRALDASTPATVRNTLRRCLEKDPKDRLRDIGDVRLALAGAFDSSEGQAASAPQRAWRRVAAIAAVALVASAATGTLVWFFTRPEPAPVAPVRFSVLPPAAAQLGQFLALSPDGGALAFFAADSGTNRLWLHSLETGDTQVLSRAGPVGGAPFWSADGRFIGYTGEGKLKKIDPSGGPPEVIADAPAAFAGGAWSQDDIVVFADAGRGLMRVPAAGGTPTPLTIVDPARKETSHSGPWFLPGGRRFLYLRSSSDAGNAGIYVGAIDARPQEQNVTRLLAAQQNPLYAPSHGTGTGHLLFMREGTLFAQAFDPDRLKLSGEIVRIADQVGTGAGTTVSYGFFTVSGSGALAYRHRQSGTGSAVWVSHTGQEAAPIAIALDRPQNPRLSPDGHKLALIVGTDVWVYDIEGRPPIRLTFGGVGAFSPLWTPDGRRLVYEGGNVALALPADGSGGTPEPMSPAKGHFHPHGWSADGQIILVAVPGTTQTNDIVKFSVVDKGDPQVVVATPANEGFFGTAVSPDGRWLAYVSDQTGRAEIWVRPYPGPGPAIRISPNGGVEPVWARTGGELYYREQNRLMATAVNAGPEFNFKPATPVFDSRYVHDGQPPTYDVGADGRFLMIKAESAGAPFNIVLNWAAGLPARAAH